MGWYGFFALFYDASLEKLYRPYRAPIAAATRAQPGDSVLDVCCGTGQSFPSLVEAVGETGRIVGVDRSSGMLRRAQRRCHRNGWGNLTLIEAGAEALSEDLLRAHDAPVNLDAVVCSLALTAVPDWEAAFLAAWDCLRPGGRFVIFDCHAETRLFQTRSVELVARADLSRRVWEPLEARCTELEMAYLGGEPKKFGGRLFLAAGTKPDAAAVARRGTAYDCTIR